MGNYFEAQKRDFLKQLIAMMEQNKQMITEKGFNAQTRIDLLNLELTDAGQTEAIQREKLAAAQDITEVQIVIPSRNNFCKCCIYWVMRFPNRVFTIGGSLACR